MPGSVHRLRFCIFVVALATLHAEDKPLGPQELLNGLMQNPEIQAARLRFEAATVPVQREMESELSP